MSPVTNRGPAVLASGPTHKEGTAMGRRLASSLLLVVGIAAGSVSVARADAANNIFRFGGAWVVPNGSDNYSDGLENVNFESTDGWGVFVDYERRLLPWLGLDFQVLYAEPDFEARTSSATVTNTVEVWNGNLGVNFHLFARS